MIKKTMIMMFALLMLTACGEANNESVGTTPFIGGTQGVKMEFLDNFPPDRVGDGNQEDFDTIIVLTNRGEAEVEAEDISVRLTGFSPRLFNEQPENLAKNAPELLERNIKNPDGSIIETFPVEVEFGPFNYQERVQGTQTFPIRAQVCYLYQTNVASSVCVKNDFRDDEQGDVCTVASTRTAFNSGAPIQVTELRQSAAREDTTRLIFTVSNRDTGDTYSKDSTCEDEGRLKDRVYIKLTGFEESQGEEVNCRSLRSDSGSGGSEGFVILGEEGSAEVSCDVKFSERTPRIQPFGIEIDYKYNENIQKDIVIERND
jgi:hypothetical protein